MQRKTITYSPADENILSQLETLVSIFNIDYKRPDKGADLPLASIQKICADAWKVPESEIIGKVNHSNSLEKERKVSFLCACYWFSNKEISEIAAYMGCTWSLVTNSRETMIYKIKYKWKFAGECLEIFKALSKKCPKRIPAYCKIDLSMIKGVDYDPKLPLELFLTPDKISELPVKNLSWFYNNNTKFTMIAYSLNGKEVVKIEFTRTSDHELLHALQAQGYRFISYDDFYYSDKIKKLRMETEKIKEMLSTYEKKSPCISCRFRNKCPLPDRTTYELNFSSCPKQSGEYVPVPDSLMMVCNN